MWKLEAEAPEAAIFHESGSGSCKHEMNGSGSGSGSSKKILEAEAASFKKLDAEAEAEAKKNSPLLHHCFPLDCDLPMAQYPGRADPLSISFNFASRV